MKGLRRALTALLTVLALCSDSDLNATEETSPRIVAVGDVHGSPEAFSRLLRAAELVDPAGHWIGGDAVLVQTGDLTDRGPGVREVLDRMRDLELSARENGGRVVALLGNHEVFNLIGYYDYESTPLGVFAEIAAAFRDDKSEKTRKSAYRQWSSWARKYPACALPTKDQWMARTPLGFIEYQEAMSPRGEYGRWLRARKIVVELEGTLFLHGGLSPELLDMELTSLDAINSRSAAELAQFDGDREYLLKQDVIPRYATFGELHCAVANELKAPAEVPLDPLVAARRTRLEEIRQRLPSAETWLLLDSRGPVWFRGYASWSDEQAETGLATVFATFGGKRVVVGHTPQAGAVVPRFDRRVFLIDTAMAYPELAGRAVALEIDGDMISTVSEMERVVLSGPAGARAVDSSEPGYPPGSVSRIEDVSFGRDASSPSETEIRNPEGTWLAEDGSPLPFEDDEAVLDFLKTARVVGEEEIGKGITGARRLVLEKGAIRARAAFHDIDVEKPRHQAGESIIMNFRDSYLNNVAAYELGRLLGISNLVPTTIRAVNGVTGSVQLWIENAEDEAQRRGRRAKAALSVDVRRRIADMWVFDNLINNVDRNQGNMLYDARGNLWMIDHTRAFSRSKRLPSPTRMKRCSKDLLAAIRSLDEDLTRARLDPYLRSFEIKTLFARRAALLKFLDKRLVTRGESTVMFSYGDPDDAVRVSFREDDVPAAPENR